MAGIALDHSSDSFTIEYSSPLHMGKEFIGEIRELIENYQQTIAAFGGYKSAIIGLRANGQLVEDWMENGLGRHVDIYDDSNSKIWEGFVNKVNVAYSGLEVAVGPLSQIANKVNLIYSTFDTSTSPPTTGVRKVTGTAEDTTSQLKYGVWHKLLSAAGVADAQATALRDTYLAVHKEPETTSDFAPEREDLRMTIECRGYMDYLSYPFNQQITGLQNLSAKIQNILTADPNGFFTDFSKITANTLQVPAWENNDSRADGLLKGLTAIGDSNQNRYIFGIYANRQPIYGPASTGIDYTIELIDSGRRIYDNQGGTVKPWHISPGKWVFFPDFLPGREFSYDLDLAKDPRMLFIEEVTFNIPSTVVLNGGKVSKLDQKLAQLGLAGISA